MDAATRELLPRSYGYSLWSRLWVSVVLILTGAPLAYVLIFLLTHIPSAGDLGPVLIAVLFLLTPPILLTLRFGHVFRRYDVEEQGLVVRSLWMRWTIGWRDVNQLVRRTRKNWLGRRTYKVRMELLTAQGGRDWVFLFDSALPEGDALYSQIVRHVRHIRPKELVDESPFGRGLR